MLIGKDNTKSTILTIALSLILSAGACFAANLPSDLDGARFVFDSDRDTARDGMNSVYLWEGGRLSKLFKGAVCPRWSLDGERIACVMREKGREGDIAILDRRGKLRKEIALGKKAQSVEWLDANTLIYAAQDSSEPEFRKTYVISYDLAGDREKILYATREGGDVYQMNWSRDRARLVLDVRDRLAASQELRRGIVILDVSAKDSSITVYELSVFKPALFHDDATLICHTDRDRAGKVVPNADTGMLAAYDIRSGVWAPIRDALNVQNTRFSRDGRYFYSSEGEGDRSIVIRLFTIKNLSDPLLRISTWNNEPSQPRKDVRPDLFVPGMKTGVFVALPVWIFGERAGGVATDAVEIATQTPTSGTLNRMPAPVSRTLTRPPAETTPASRTLTRMPTEPAPVAEETLPQLNSIGTKPFEKTPMTPEQYAEQLRGTPPSEGQATFEAMQSPLPEKTPMTPEQYAEQLRGTPPGEGQTNFEAMPAEQSQQLTKNPTPSGDIPKTVSGTPKLTSEISKPIPATQERLTLEGNKPLTKTQAITSEAKKSLTSTALQPLSKATERPPWARGPAGSIMTPNGWYYNLPGGGRFSVEFSDDWMTRKTTQTGTGDSDYTETVPVKGSL